MASVSIDRLNSVNPGRAIKAPCVTATTGNITLSGLQTIAGVALADGDRVLVKNQTATTDNGVYAATTSAWTRALDFDSGSEITQGTIVPVEQGTEAGYYKISTSGDIVIGTTALTFVTALVSDSSMVGFTQSGTGAVQRTTQSKLRETSVTPQDFGAVADGTSHPLSGYFATLANAQAVYPHATSLTNEIDWAASYAALSLVGAKVRLPKASYIWSAGIVPTCSEIEGDGELSTIIKPTSAVTKCLSIGGTNYPTKIGGFQIDGVNTSGATLLFLGDASAATCDASNIRLKNATGTNGVGLRLGNVLKSNFRHITAEDCNDGALFEGVAGSFPTTLYLQSCVFTGNDRYGAYIKSGHSIRFGNTDFESNQNEGLYIAPSAADATEIILESGCWFEANQAAFSGATRQTKYHMTAIAGGRTVRPVLRDVFFATGTNLPLAANFDGSGTNFVLDNVQIASSVGGEIRAANSASGWVSASNRNLASMLNDASGLALGAFIGPGAPWVDISAAVTFSSSVGNSATTFNSVTMDYARIRRVGKCWYIDINFVGTLKAVTPGFIQVSLPAGDNTLNNVPFRPAIVKDNGTWEIGYCRPDGGVGLLFYRGQLGNYTSGGNVGGRFSGIVEFA